MTPSDGLLQPGLLDDSLGLTAKRRRSPAMTVFLSWCHCRAKTRQSTRRHAPGGAELRSEAGKDAAARTGLLHGAGGNLPKLALLGNFSVGPEGLLCKISAAAAKAAKLPGGWAALYQPTEDVTLGAERSRDSPGVTAKCGCAPGVDGRVLRPAMTARRGECAVFLSLPGFDPATHPAGFRRPRRHDFGRLN